jgi:hypothetical protein
MTKTALKKELHKAIDNIDDDTLLEAIYTILNSRANSYSFELSDEDLRIVEERRTLYEAGKLKTTTLAGFKKKVKKKLSK